MSSKTVIASKTFYVATTKKKKLGIPKLCFIYRIYSINSRANYYLIWTSNNWHAPQQTPLNNTRILEGFSTNTI